MVQVGTPQKVRTDHFQNNTSGVEENTWPPTSAGIMTFLKREGNPTFVATCSLAAQPFAAYGTDPLERSWR